MNGIKKHTPAPWCVGNIQSKRYAGYPGESFEASIHIGDKSNRGNCLAIVYMGGEGATRNSRDAIEENARRIVACVNACEGIPTEALECQTKKQLTAKLLNQVSVLIDLLEMAAARIEIANAEGNPMLSAWLPDARKAIAEARVFRPS